MKSTKLLFAIGLCVLLCMFSLLGCSSVLKEDVKPPQENSYTYEEDSKLISSVGSESKSFAGAEFFDHDNLHFCKLGSTVLLKSGDSKDEGMSGFDIHFSTALDGQVRVSVDKAAVFDSFSDAGIAANDLQGKDYFSEKDDFCVIILDFSVENIDIAFTGDDPLEDFNISNLLPAYLGQKTEEELLEDFQNWTPDIDYFSGHGGDTEYFHFRVQPGEKDSFQMGFSVPKEVVEKKEIALQIGAGSRRKFYFDILGIVEAE